MSAIATRSRAELLEQVPKIKWAHSIDLGEGISSPGAWGTPNPLIVDAFDAVDFRGKKVLDIGCWDGLWSFEAEKRGATEVYATDILSQRPLGEYSTFEVARALRGSKAKYFSDVSVFDVAKLGVKDFDVVIYCGIYYHLRDPLLAFARLRQVMKDGGILITSGHVIPSDEVFARFYYKNAFAGDHTNWWVPSTPCLRQWIESSFFEIQTEHSTHPDVRAITAAAVRRKDPGYLAPDGELKDFDLNTY